MAPELDREADSGSDVGSGFRVYCSVNIVSLLGIRLQREFVEEKNECTVRATWMMCIGPYA